MSKFDRQPISSDVLRTLDKLRGREPRGLREIAEFLREDNIQLSPDDLAVFGRVFASRLYQNEMLGRAPEWLDKVFVKLAEGVSPEIICDPWASIGFLAGVLQGALQPKEVIAITCNDGEQALGKVLAPKIDWRLGDAAQILGEEGKEIDVVASVLPMNARSHAPLEVTTPDGVTLKLKDELGNLVLVTASMRLSPSGIGLFVVPPSFFSRRSVFHRFAELGLGVEAALAIPPGAFAPYTNIRTHLVIVRRTSLSRMFVAQLSTDENSNQQIIENLQQSKEGGSLELGRFVSPQSFSGLDAIRVAEKVTAAEQRFGAPAVALSELATAINLGRHGDDFTFNNLENTFYIPLIGKSDVVDLLDDLSLKKQNYAQVTIDSKRSSASFVARFLNSQFGKELREQSKSGTTIPKLNKSTLKELRIFVPDIETQKRMLEIEADIAAENNTVLALQNELSELSRELWANPENAHNVKKQIRDLTKRLAGGIKQHTSAEIEQWFETLPFPLASILRAWQATPSQDYKAKYEHLLHFFEATAEFVGIILLSAFSSNEAFFEPHKQKLLKSMNEMNFSYKRSTFGTWKLVVEYLGKQTRDLLTCDEGDNIAMCKVIFADPTLSLPQSICRKELVAILSTTNSMRNNWSGHGGTVGQDEAKLRNEKLFTEVQRLREVFADAWTEIQLMNALHCINQNGVFENEVSILMGSNNEFLKEKRAMTICMDVKHLYLTYKSSGQALQLLPLIQIGPSPQSTKNACYFFSRIDNGGARFISYHYSDEPERKEQFGEVVSAIKFLSQTDNQNIYE